MIVEGDIGLEFDAPWLSLQWDGCEFRTRRSHHGKAADVVAVDDSDSDGALLLIEIKDYPNHPDAVVHEPSDLAAMCALKARDTLAQMLFSAALANIGRPADAEVDTIIRAFGSTTRPLTFILLVEDANEPPLEMLELEGELERAFRWLPTEATTAASIDELDALVDGLAVTRL